MTQCRRCGQECGDHGYTNTICNSWIGMCEEFTLCRRCQNNYLRKTVRFINSYEERPEKVSE